MPLNPVHQDLSSNTNRTFQFLWNFQLRFNLIFSEEIIQYSRTCKSPKRHGAKPMHPSLSRAFQRHREQDLKHPGSVDLITTKQNKLPSFVDRLMVGIRANAPTWGIRKKILAAFVYSPVSRRISSIGHRISSIGHWISSLGHLSPD
jgi:hypothetical protein